jgi:hypothetical protein
MCVASCKPRWIPHFTIARLGGEELASQGGWTWCEWSGRHWFVQIGPTKEECGSPLDLPEMAGCRDLGVEYSSFLPRSFPCPPLRDDASVIRHIAVVYLEACTS